MKFSTVVVSSALIASALALPKSEFGLEARLRRRALGRSTKPLTLVEGNKTEETALLSSNVLYSTNWAGVIIQTPPSGTTWDEVTASATVPTPKVPSGGTSSSYSGSAWVGIDGDTCESAILQTGFDFTVTKAGAVSYDAWYEWYPDYAYDFNLAVSAGNVIKMTVKSTSTTAGTATLENVTTGKTVSKALTSSSKLCGENAEWIVEAFEEGNSQVILANFGTIEFTGAVATTYAGSTEGPSSGSIIDMETSSGQVETSVTDTSSTVTVTYV